MLDSVLLSTPPRLRRPITPKTPFKQNRHCYALNMNATPTKVSRIELSVEPLNIHFKSTKRRRKRKEAFFTHISLPCSKILSFHD